MDIIPSEGMVVDPMSGEEAQELSVQLFGQSIKQTSPQCYCGKPVERGLHGGWMHIDRWYDSAHTVSLSRWPYTPRESRDV